MRHFLLSSAALVLFTLAGCADDPVYWPGAFATDTATDTTGDASGTDTGATGDVSEDSTPSDVAEDTTEPDVGEPDMGEPDMGEPDMGEPDMGEPDMGEPDADPTFECEDGGDEHGDCDSCQAAEFGPGGCCESEGNACSGSSDCIDFINCLQECEGDENCVNSCVGDFPAGVELYQELAFCAVGDGGGSFIGACGSVCL